MWETETNSTSENTEGTTKHLFIITPNVNGSLLSNEKIQADTTGHNTIPKYMMFGRDSHSIQGQLQTSKNDGNRKTM